MVRVVVGIVGGETRLDVEWDLCDEASDAVCPVSGGSGLRLVGGVRTRVGDVGLSGLDSCSGGDVTGLPCFLVDRGDLSGVLS